MAAHGHGRGGPPRLQMSHCWAWQPGNKDEGGPYLRYMDEGSTFTLQGRGVHLHVTLTRGTPSRYMKEGSIFTLQGRGVHLHVTWTRGPPSGYMDEGSTFTLHGRGVHLHVTWTRGPPSRYMDKGSTLGLYIISVLRGGPDRASHIYSFHTGVGLKYR